MRRNWPCSFWQRGRWVQRPRGRYQFEEQKGQCAKAQEAREGQEDRSQHTDSRRPRKPAWFWFWWQYETHGGFEAGELSDHGCVYKKKKKWLRLQNGEWTLRAGVEVAGVRCRGLDGRWCWLEPRQQQWGRENIVDAELIALSDKLDVGWAGKRRIKDECRALA